MFGVCAHVLISCFREFVMDNRLELFRCGHEIAVQSGSADDGVRLRTMVERHESSSSFARRSAPSLPSKGKRSIPWIERMGGSLKSKRFVVMAIVGATSFGVDRRGMGGNVSSGVQRTNESRRRQVGHADHQGTVFPSFLHSIIPSIRDITVGSTSNGLVGIEWGSGTDPVEASAVGICQIQ